MGNDISHTQRTIPTGIFLFSPKTIGSAFRTSSHSAVHSRVSETRSGSPFQGSHARKSICGLIKLIFFFPIGKSFSQRLNTKMNWCWGWGNILRDRTGSHYQNRMCIDSGIGIVGIVIFLILICIWFLGRKFFSKKESFHHKKEPKEPVRV